MESDKPDSGLEIDFRDISLAQTLFGEHNANLRLIEKIFAVEITAAGSHLTVRGSKESPAVVRQLLQSLYEIEQDGMPFQGGQFF